MLVAKVVALALGVSAGLPLGQEGPHVHVAHLHLATDCCGSFLKSLKSDGDLQWAEPRPLA